MLLSACVPMRRTARLNTPTPLPSLPPIPTLADMPHYTFHPAPTQETALQEPTPVPINVVVEEADSACGTPFAAPTPAPAPPVGEIDATTGRHVMGLVQVLDPRSYRLAVTGLVDQPLSLAVDDLHCMPRMTETVTTTCYNFADTATWSGVLLSQVLQKAGVRPGAQKLIQTGADGAKRTVSIEMAMDPHNFLAYQMGNKEIPVLFGFPVRSIFIDVAGQYSVKWLTALEVV